MSAFSQTADELGFGTPVGGGAFDTLNSFSVTVYVDDPNADLVDTLILQNPLNDLSFLVPRVGYLYAARIIPERTRYTQGYTP